MTSRVLRVLASVAFAAFAASVAPACTDDPIVLASAPDPDAAIPGMHCTSDAECDGASFCSKTSCDADADGYCLSIVTLAYDDDPVCGCNGVTYFNDSFRRAERVSLRARDWCPPELAAPCGGENDKHCPKPSHSCARLSRDFDGHACPPPGAPGPGLGHCWSIPQPCLPPTTRPQFIRCNLGEPHCVDTCSAIQDGEPYLSTSHCL